MTKEVRPMDPRHCPLCRPNLKEIAATAREMDDPLLVAYALSGDCPHTRQERRNESKRLREQRSEGSD